MRLSILPQLLFAAALAVPGSAALADPVYKITVIGGAGSAAVDINHRGDVVGHFTIGGATRGFVYTGGELTEIGTFGGQSSVAVAINDLGQVWAAPPRRPAGTTPSCSRTAPCRTSARWAADTAMLTTSTTRA